MTEKEPVEVERKKDINALILMMGVLSEKLSELSRIMIRIDEKSSEMLKCLKTANGSLKQEDNKQKEI